MKITKSELREMIREALREELARSRSSLKESVWYCFFDDREVGTVEAATEEEALEKMMQEYPEHPYGLYDGCFWVEPLTEGAYSGSIAGNYRDLLKKGLKESASSGYLKLHKDPSEQWWEYDQDCYLIGKDQKHKVNIIVYESEADDYNEQAIYKIDVELDGVNFEINHRKLAEIVGCSNLYLQKLEWNEAVRMCNKIYSYFMDSKDDTYFLLVNDLGCPATEVAKYFDANSELSIERFGEMYENLWNSNHSHPYWLKMEKLLDAADPKQEMSPEEAYEASSSEVRAAVSNLITSIL